MEDSIKEEAIWEKLSGIERKVDVLLSNTAKQVQSVQIPQETKPVITKEDVESIVRISYKSLGKFILDNMHVPEMKKLEVIQNSIIRTINKLDDLPPPEKISLEPILQLFPKPKKVNICGFEFLRTSVVIAGLITMAFISLTINIKQMDDNRILKAQYIEQYEYIRQIQETQSTEPAVSKGKIKATEKKK